MVTCDVPINIWWQSAMECSLLPANSAHSCPDEKKKVGHSCHDCDQDKQQVFVLPYLPYNKTMLQLT